MKFSWVKKWSLRLVILMLVMTIISFFWVDYHIDHMWGAHTNTVNPEQFNYPQTSILIKNVTVLSEDGMSMLPHQDVFIKQGKIAQIIATGTSTFVADQVLNGSSQYLIPGLIDSHVHLWQSQNDLLLYVANGVTHVRELNGSTEHLQWKKQIENGRMGPRMFVASSRVNTNDFFTAQFQAWTAKMNSLSENSDVDAFVKSHIEQGYDAIKVYTFLENNDYHKLLAAAKKASIDVIGHLPIGIKLPEFWSLNQKELAHTEEIVKALNREFGGYDTPNVDEFLSFVKSRSKEVVKQLYKNDVAVVSTLWLMESFAKQKSALDETLKSVELSYVNPGITEGSPLADRVMGWLPGHNIYRLTGHHTTEELQDNFLYWQTYARANQILLKAMTDANVRVLAGTDANVPVAVPGFSMHDELISLVKAGFSNAQALYAATAEPAEHMKVTSGRIKVGFNADLVLLTANPLENIAHTKKIDTVIVNGRLIERSQLDDMLNAVKSANDDSRTVGVDHYH